MDDLSRWRIGRNGAPHLHGHGMTLAVYESAPGEGEWFWQVIRWRPSGIARSALIPSRDEAMADGLRFYEEVVATPEMKRPSEDESLGLYQDDEDEAVTTNSGWKAGGGG
jgi:hypothetical protein